MRVRFLESDKCVLLVTSEFLFYDHSLSAYIIQLTDYELVGTFINQHNFLLIQVLAHLSRHPSSSSVDYEQYSHSWEDTSLWITPEWYEL
jgi:hypothetical protein